jgi:hypothetical protein
MKLKYLISKEDAKKLKELAASLDKKHDKNIDKKTDKRG